MERELLKSKASKVEISDIDLAPGPFSMSFHFNLEPLKASINRFGVLNPPYLLKNSDSRFTVVAGYRRLLAVRELGWTDILCQIAPDTFRPFKALLLNLSDNITHRQLNTIEKAMVLKRLTRFLKREEIIADFMPIIGIRANKQTLELFLGLEELEEAIRASVAMERLSLRVAGLMRSIARDDRLRINDLLTSIKWSFNQQWEATQWIIEIASREGCSIKDVIDGGEITEVLNSQRMNNPQKVRSIVKTLRARRFPTLVETEKLFRKGLSHLSLPLGVKIIPPPFFEGVGYRLEIVFTKGQELKGKLAELSRFSGLEGVTDFWKGKEHR
ncbi:MAG: ParB N-terminal domain-containing protein [Deltaproteobacteria bacterium]|nr:MAG: ParB N-terminal domain-containing protein [Deltaproteobacteria bacterium]